MTVFSVASGTLEHRRLIGPRRRADAQQRVGREQRAEQHHLRREEQPDPQLRVGQAGVGPDLGGVGMSCSISACQHDPVARRAHGSSRRSTACCGVKSAGAPGTLYSYGSRYTRGGSPEVAVRIGGVGAAHSSVVASHGLAAARRPARMLTNRLTMKKSWKNARPKAAYDHRDVQIERGLRVRVERAAVPQPPVHAGQPLDEHRHEDHVHAHERADEVDPPERLVHHPARRSAGTSNRCRRTARRSCPARRDSGSGATT